MGDLLRTSAERGEALQRRLGRVGISARLRRLDRRPEGHRNRFGLAGADVEANPPSFKGFSLGSSLPRRFALGPHGRDIDALGRGGIVDIVLRLARSTDRGKFACYPAPGERIQLDPESAGQPSRPRQSICGPIVTVTNISSLVIVAWCHRFFSRASLCVRYLKTLWRLSGFRFFSALKYSPRIWCRENAGGYSR